MSTHKTAVQVDNEVHQYLFTAKERPGESFNAALRRELGMSEPAEGNDVDDAEESAEDVAAETES